jgi:hypothetical protein
MSKENERVERTIQKQRVRRRDFLSQFSFNGLTL